MAGYITIYQDMAAAPTRICASCAGIQLLVVDKVQAKMTLAGLEAAIGWTTTRATPGPHASGQVEAAVDDRGMERDRCDGSRIAQK